MSKKFYAWKNRDCNGINPEWIELTGREFVELCKANKNLPDEEKRWFYKLPGFEEGDDYLVLECTHQKYLKSQVEKEKRAYKVEIWDMYQVLSFDFVYTDDSGEEYTLHDIIEDSRVNVEEQATDDLYINALYEAINKLNQDEKEFILNWIEKKKAGLSDDKIADSLHITRDKLRWMYKQVCSELKNFLKIF